MSLRHALLALLRVSPLTGYDLQKEFSVSVGHVWHAPDSQIYPELRKMEAEGLIEGEVLPWGTKGKKRQYRVTAEGDRFFLGWMNEPLVYARCGIPHICAPPTLNQPLPPPHVSSFSGTVPTMPSS